MQTSNTVLINWPPPILRAAGLNPSNVRILVINDGGLNAFVISGRAIFIYSGLLQRAGSAGQLQSIIAHEGAHIANGHITRRLSNLRSTNTAAGFGLASALAVAIASDDPTAAGGIAAGATSSAKRQFFAHTRAEEAAAGQSSIRFMLHAGVDPERASEVLDLFRSQEALSVSRQDPFARAHPLTSDRIRILQGLIAQNPENTKSNPNVNFWFARAQGKLIAFIQNSSWTLRRVQNDESPVGLMRAAVAYHRQANANAAIQAIQSLLAHIPMTRTGMNFTVRSCSKAVKQARQ